MATSTRYAPPPERFGASSMGLALLAHGILIAALTWGTSWRSQPNTITTAAAELWAELPLQAAPPLAPQPLVALEPIPEPSTTKTPEIVVEKIKPKLNEKLEPPKKDLKSDATKRKAQEAESQAERLREQLRQDQIKRMGGLAGAAGTATSTGTALQSAAPKADYMGFLQSLVAPNINYQSTALEKSGLMTSIEFQVLSDGTISRPRIYKTSGNKEWDAIAIRAVEKTENVPRDKKGYRYEGSIIMDIKPIK